VYFGILIRQLRQNRHTRLSEHRELYKRASQTNVEMMMLVPRQIVVAIIVQASLFGTLLATTDWHDDSGKKTVSVKENAFASVARK
jgi:hypothetical protein